MKLTAKHADSMFCGFKFVKYYLAIFYISLSEKNYRIFRPTGWVIIIN